VLEQRAAVDQIFHALGDPARRAMVDRLSRGPASVSELAAPFDMTLAAVVQHVQVLERSGLIDTKKVGRVRTCQLAPTGLAAAERWLADRRALWEGRFDRIESLLAEAPATPSTQKPRRKRKKP
jgi:DNA-binding transcriptional ArsR family regulator